MKLNLEQLKQITTGAVNIRKENGMFLFSRFTEEQEKLYQITYEGFSDKTHTTSGIKFSFKTDSKNLFTKIKTSQKTTRTYFSVDVFVNEVPIGYIDNFSEVKLEGDYTKDEFSLGEFSKNFMLGDGEKTVCVHLPWSVKTLVEEISIDDDAFIEGIKPAKKLLAFGDSITQGYDALRPSNRYVAKLADKLDAEEFNKGIGGECFFPDLAELKEAFVPDYITVAYGTNDWSKIDKETFKKNSKAFYENISKNYPDSKIFAITPIWRKDCNEAKPMGEFQVLEQYIKEAVAECKNVTIIPGYNLVPGDECYFADLWLHPNDDGFEHYVENLYNKIIVKIQ